MKLFDELKWRGLIQDVSSPKLEEMINNGGLTFYIGTDPTASSMHIGHYSSFSVAKRLADGGHKPILLVGGATGLIGDPKPNSERPMITKEELEKNYKGLRKQVEDIFGFEVVNNYDWSKNINFIDYLRDYGKYFSLNYMLSKETVKSRLDIGITYTEFSYMILQALDFLWLYENKNCLLQIGGQDQWGNITAGIELTRKKVGAEVFAFTMPLILDANGNKFGKSEGNAIWLDKNLTTPYELYQFFINQEDKMIIKYLKMLSFLTPDEIMEIEKIHKQKPELRIAQKALAENIISFLHGKDEFIKAKETSEKIFKGEITDMMPTVVVTGSKNIVDVLINANLAPSKSEVRRLITQGGIEIDKVKITDPNYEIIKDEVIIKKGKKSIIKIILK
ncbi:MAG: tyrosine--tRNA ligase [Bacilli bacterium]|nr:tyrosine--tRNA ligase [Bacilli bacterium]MDD4406453.1 tyrosine--tRNA ligase [Bacilli bacterium]